MSKWGHSRSCIWFAACQMIHSHYSTSVVSDTVMSFYSLSWWSCGDIFCHYLHFHLPYSYWYHQSSSTANKMPSLKRKASGLPSLSPARKLSRKGTYRCPSLWLNILTRSRWKWWSVWFFATPIPTVSSAFACFSITTLSCDGVTIALGAGDINLVITSTGAHVRIQEAIF